MSQKTFDGSYFCFVNRMDMYTRTQLFKKCNLGQNYPDLEIPCFAIQDQLILLTFTLAFQSKIFIGLC